MPNNAFFKFFQDLVLSRTWRKLTPSARALYPVLAVHTDRDFKPVWPSLKRLKDLSGLGNSGITSALRSLEQGGLIRIWSGKHRDGNRNNTYEFRFAYPGCQIDLIPQRGKATPATGVGVAPPRDKATPLALESLAPQEDKLPPQKVTNKRKKTTSEIPTKTTTTIHGDVHINIDHGPKPAVVDSLKQFFTDTLAQKLAHEYPPDYIQEKIEITRYNHERGKVRDPAAYLRKALSHDYTRPPGFVTTTERGEEDARGGEVRSLMERIRDQRVRLARHHSTGEVSLVDVPTDLAYIILQGRHGTRCINSWDDVQHYDFE
ncbi:MAG TPA: helix-turn-helix domain-containing protein [Planctomycetota bacterium]|nr:helix-turn-helix domain-containing protein [Planctomycetota bacterium]